MPSDPQIPQFLSKLKMRHESRVPARWFISREVHSRRRLVECNDLRILAYFVENGGIPSVRQPFAEPERWQSIPIHQDVHSPTLAKRRVALFFGDRIRKRSRNQNKCGNARQTLKPFPFLSAGKKRKHAKKQQCQRESRSLCEIAQGHGRSQGDVARPTAVTAKDGG